jgi:hypothetical protein
LSTLALAVERKQWELASLCLLVGVAEAAATLPPGAFEGLLEVLSGMEVGESRPRGGSRPVGKPGTSRDRRR